MKNLLFALAALSLAACTPSPEPSLQEKLAGKSPEERRAILARECYREVNRSGRTGHPADGVHTYTLLRICDESTAAPVGP